MLLYVDRVSKYYGAAQTVTKALDDISLQITKGEFVGVMGPSGSGKTSLLNCISTVDYPTAGNIYLGNKNITEYTENELAKFRRDNLGFIFQESRLLDVLTIEENIALPLVIKGEDADEISKKVIKMANHLNITEELKKYPYEVSGGQRQRSATARALISGPQLVLADEPTGALDSNSTKMLMALLEEINQSTKTTILLVTHDPVAASYAHRILFLRDGRIFNEIRRGEKSRVTFYHEILNVLSLIGGR